MKRPASSVCIQATAKQRRRNTPTSTSRATPASAPPPPPASHVEALLDWMASGSNASSGAGATDSRLISTGAEQGTDEDHELYTALVAHLRRHWQSRRPEAHLCHHGVCQPTNVFQLHVRFPALAWPPAVARLLEEAQRRPRGMAAWSAAHWSLQKRRRLADNVYVCRYGVPHVCDGHTEASETDHGVPCQLEVASGGQMVCHLTGRNHGVFINPTIDGTPRHHEIGRFSKKTQSQTRREQKQETDTLAHIHAISSGPVPSSLSETPETGAELASDTSGGGEGGPTHCRRHRRRARHQDRDPRRVSPYSQQAQPSQPQSLPRSQQSPPPPPPPPLEPPESQQRGEAHQGPERDEPWGEAGERRWAKEKARRGARRDHLIRMLHDLYVPSSERPRGGEAHWGRIREHVVEVVLAHWELMVRTMRNENQMTFPAFEQLALTVLYYMQQVGLSWHQTCIIPPCAFLKHHLRAIDGQATHSHGTSKTHLQAVVRQGIRQHQRMLRTWGERLPTQRLTEAMQRQQR